MLSNDALLSFLLLDDATIWTAGNSATSKQAGESVN
jgi:hypothetical protein